MLAILVSLMGAATPSDLYALAEAALSQHLPRASTVLLQGIAYRAQDTPEAREAFRALEQHVPRDLCEPHYAFGYLWPHTTRSSKISPYEAARARIIREEIGAEAAVELMPLWSLFICAEPCIQALTEKQAKRSLVLKIRTADPCAPKSLGELVDALLRIAPDWEDRRMLAGLILDLSEREGRDAANAIQRVAESPLFRSLADERIPPGCDTHDVSWEAFRQARDNPDRSMEPTFRVLLERAKVRNAGKEEAKSRRQKATFRLEMAFEEYDAGGIPLRDAIDLLADWAGTEDASPWEELRERGFDPDKAVYSKAWAWEHLPARTILQRLVFEAYEGRLAWKLADDGSIVVHAQKD